MCFGGRSKAPRIIYQGPSRSDVEASREALERYRQQSMQQNQVLAESIQQQIQAANKRAEDFLSRLEEQREQAAVAPPAPEINYDSYVVRASDAEPINPLITELAGSDGLGWERKPTLRIGPGGRTAVKQGSGLNIGI